MAEKIKETPKVKTTTTRPVQVETQQRPKVSKTGSGARAKKVARKIKPDISKAEKARKIIAQRAKAGGASARQGGAFEMPKRPISPAGPAPARAIPPKPTIGSRVGKFAKGVGGRGLGLAGGAASLLASPITLPFIAEALADKTPQEAGGTVASTLGKIGRDIGISAKDIFTDASPEEIAQMRDENYRQSFAQFGMPQTEAGGAQDYIDWRGRTPAIETPITPAQAASPITAPVVTPVASPVASADPAAADTGYRQVVDPQGRITLTNRPGNQAVLDQVASDRARGVAGAFDVGGNVQEVFNNRTGVIPGSLAGQVTDLTQNKFTGVDAHGLSDTGAQGGNVDTIRHAANVLSSDRIPIQSQVLPGDTGRALPGTGTDITGEAPGFPQGAIQVPVNTNAPFMASPVSQPGTVDMTAGPDGAFVPDFAGARDLVDTTYTPAPGAVTGQAPSLTAGNDPQVSESMLNQIGADLAAAPERQMINRAETTFRRNTIADKLTDPNAPADNGFVNALAQGFDLAGEATTGAGAIGRANQARGFAASKMKFDDTQRALANRESRTAIDQSKLGLDQQRVSLAQQQFDEGAPERAAEVAQKEARTAAMVQQTTAFNNAVDQYGLDAALKLVNPADKVMAAQMKQAADIAETLATMPGYDEMTPDELFKQAMSTVVETQEKISAGYRRQEVTPAVPASSGIPFLPFDSTEAQKATYAWQK